jgi:uncharacterized protein (TIGR03066 family)
MTPRPQTVLGCLLTAAAADADGATDADLLARFARDRDEAAFELLVWRHAGMVLRACRSRLRDYHAAEDACQAVFLALARQARAVGRRGTVTGWLYTVARRIAARTARRRADRLPASDDGLDHLPAPTTEPGPDPDAVRLLFEELDRLPDKYRAPLLLCFLDGLSHADAARRLGVPVGTVAGWVARAKERLHRRLVGRGVAVPAAGLGVLVAHSTVGAVAPAFVAATARAAVALAAGGSPDMPGRVLDLTKKEVRAMTVTKLKWAGALTACAVLAFGVAWAAGPGHDPAAPPAAGPPAAAASDPPAPGGPDRRGGAKEDDPVKLFRAMQQKVAAAKTLRVRFDLTVTGADGGKGIVKGSLTLGAGDKYRVELDGKLFGHVVKETEVSDGTAVRSSGTGANPEGARSPKEAGAYLRRALPVEGFFLASLNLDRRGFREEAGFKPTDLKSGGTEQVMGREAHVVHFTLPANRDGDGAKGMPATVWLDGETGLPLKFAVTGGTSDVREVTETYSEFALDPKVDAKTFELPADKAPDPPADDPLKKELAKLEGTWVVVTMEVNGKSLLEEGKPEPPLVIKGGKMTFDAKQAPGGWDLAKVLDPTKTPKQITVPNFHGGDPKAGVTVVGIYEVNGDELRFCVQEVETARLKEREKERPTAFDSNQGVLTVYKREKDSSDDAKRIQGTWAVDAEATLKEGGDSPAIKEAREELAAMRFVFAGDKLTIREPSGPTPTGKGRDEEDTFRLDPSKKPKQIDLSGSARGIYELKGDTLKLCLDIRGKEHGRPTQFGFDKDKATVVYYVLKREKPAPPGGEKVAPIDAQTLQGTWELVSEVIDGKKTDLAGPRAEWVFRDDRVTDRLGGKELFRTGYRLLPSSDPKGFDLMERDGKRVANAAIYTLEGDTFTIAFFREDGKGRPKDFKSEPGDGKVVRVYQRQRPAAPPGGAGNAKIDPSKLVGKWRAKEGAKGGFDFTKDGKVTITASLGGEQVTFEGTYRVDGNKVISTVEFGGKRQDIALTATKLTDTELVVKDEKGAETTLVRVKDKK